MRRIKLTALAAALLLLSACGSAEQAGGELTEWAAGKLNDALEVVGGGIQGALDDLHNADYQGGPFENDIDSARAYLLEQMQEKYGIEFAVVGKEDLVNYGALAGATYTCKVAPVDAPEQVTTALVSQSMYRDVRDDYAIYFFKEEAEAPVVEFCESKEYVLDQHVSLQMPGTSHTWSADDGLNFFLRNSGAKVEAELLLEDGLDTETYAEQILDFLGDVDQLSCNLIVLARTSQEYLFLSEPNVLDGFDAGSYTLEDIREEIEIFLKAGSPQSF